MDNAKIEKMMSLWKEFAERQKDSQEKFKLNPDAEKVKLLAKGVLINEKNKGLKFCPCRMISGNPGEDVRLICPCNFKMQKTWKEKGECWCSLFVKA